MNTSHMGILILVALECVVLATCELESAAVWMGMIGLALIFYLTHDEDTILPATGKGVLITGCDSGFGKALAQCLDKLGCTVFAGCLNAEGEGAKDLKSIGSKHLHVLQMDVTSPKQIQEVKGYIEKIVTAEAITFWSIVNNAGLNFLGDIELTTMKQFEKVCDINIMGMVRVTKAFLPWLRNSKGHVVNVTSVKGLLSTHANGAYNITKYAGETFSDILRLEMKKWGVSVSIIEPGHYGGATGCLYVPRIKADFEEMWDDMDDETREAYGREYVDRGWQSADAAKLNTSLDITPVVDTMSRAVLAKRPRARYLIPGSNQAYDIFKWLIIIKPFIPTSWLDVLTEYFMNHGAPQPAAFKK